MCNASLVRSSKRKNNRKKNLEVPRGTNSRMLHFLLGNLYFLAPIGDESMPQVTKRKKFCDGIT